MSVLGPLRAPEQDRAILAVPPLRQVGELLGANRELLAQYASTVQGQYIVELRDRARKSLTDAAHKYTVQNTQSLTLSSSPVFMAGHQPELFHPGVWVKNFAINGLARAHDGVPINLVVDNDTVKTTALKIPALREEPGRDGQPRHAHSVTVPFDAGIDEISYEERRVHDETLFASFPERVAEHSRAWSFEPLVGRLWDKGGLLSTPLLGERFAAARREIEREWGCDNLEVPVSHICRLEAFARFAHDLLIKLPRFHRIYNEAVHAYRRRNGLRSRNHPVPDLAVDGDWLEAPFWVWRSGGRRGRLFARRAGDHIELRGWPGAQVDLPAGPGGTEAWQEMSARGYKVRSRALTNTLFARLFLCDLFVHGIGGGKYDDLTDELIRQYFGVQPPRFLVLSATVYLPFSTFPVEVSDCRQLAHKLRDLRFNPQRHGHELAAVAAPLGELLEMKRAEIGAVSTEPGMGYERYRALRRLNTELEPFFSAMAMRLRNDLTACQEKLAANAVLRRRDYSFCLYPESTLRSFCEQFLG